MNIVAVLELARDIDPAVLRAALRDRVPTVPRLRQRLVDPALHVGRPLWVEDAGFVVDRHLSVTRCPAPADEGALLEVAAAQATCPLPRNQPLWRATHVTGLTGGRGALILVVHHAVADGIGGLAVLAQLADHQTPPASGPRLEPPSPAAELHDLVRSWTRWLTSLPGLARLAPAAVSELSASARRTRAPACSLNQPIGAGRRLAVVRTDLAGVVETAHQVGATVNDVLLTATVDALGAVLATGGERVASLVVSVPVSRRTATNAAALGNQVGAMLVRVPCQGPLLDRLRSAASETRARRSDDHHRAASAAVLGPAFGVLARLGLFHRFIGRQRLVNTFVTNLHGPTSPLSLVGVPVTAIIPMSPIAGNVTVAFTALSYAGTLSVTVVADSGRWPSAYPIAAALERALSRLRGEGPGVSAGASARSTPSPASGGEPWPSQ